MPRRLILFGGILLTLAAWVIPATTQVEFIASLQNISTGADGVTVLTMQLTPTISVPVRVTDDTEIKDDSDLPISTLDLAAGMVLKIEGVFTPAGILAEEIEIQQDGAQFEIRGVITEVTPDGGGGSIVVSDFPIQVPDSAEIRSQHGDPLMFDDLAVGQFARVSGSVQGDQLVASRVTIRRPFDGFARIRLQGVISEIINDATFTVMVDGGVSAQVEINEDTEIRGVLAVGALVRVDGTLTESLSVLARRIVVIPPIRIAPKELELEPGETGPVSLILLAPRDEDTVFDLVSTNPDIATPSVDSLTIPAGELTASFDVAAGDEEGEAFIEVSTEGFEGRVKVEVGTEDEEPPVTDLRLRWEPRVIHAAPNGSREVRLRINDRAPEDLLVTISRESGTEDLLSFPEEVTIPAGSKEVRLVLTFLGSQGNAVLRAVLPDSVGGDQDDLEIALRPDHVEKLEIEFNPESLRLSPGETGKVHLNLDRPAPFDLEVLITPQGGNAAVALGVPTRVTFLEGEPSVMMEFTAGTQPGKRNLRAALPVQVGGDSAELEIEVKR